ncbi:MULTISPECIES: hypothetical protein [Bacillus]|uniref:hypothetical protein n=1 Tax=Bacillus TaxID=1386 RepID=UPI001BB31A57|nr:MULTISPECIES: hypothetical protein [Bacillus]BCC80210.1 hypothetical protein BCJMU62_p219 [Bacillus cereus]GMB79175.1 hypothetical protein BCER1_55760 [Bacillus cereus]
MNRVENASENNRHGKKSRGKIKKFSIRLSQNAHDLIEIMAANTGATRSQIVAYAISCVRKNMKSRDEVLDLQQTITLLKKHFVLSLTETISNQLTLDAIDYDIKKNVLFGLLVSDYIESMDSNSPWLKPVIHPESQTQYKIYMHQSYYDAIQEYSTTEYVQLKIPVALGILQGPSSISHRDFNEYIGTSTTLPISLIAHIQQESVKREIPEYVYVDSCVKAFWDNTKKQT